MSQLNVDTIKNRLGTAGPTLPSLSVTNDASVGGALTVSGNFTVNGVQTIINTNVLDVKDGTIGIGSTSSPTDALADGDGIVIYGTTNKTWTWERDTGCFEYSEPNKFKGVVETVSAATTYNTAAGRLVLELDLRQATTFTYNMPIGNIGIVSFKNMPAFTGAANGVTATVIFTQNATAPTGGVGNTAFPAGIGTNITIVGYENGANVGAISTTALVGSATTVFLSNTASDRDFVSFFIHYTGGTNTTASSYQVYATKNGGFRQGNLIV